MTVRRNRPLELTDAVVSRAIPAGRLEIRDDGDENTFVLEGYASTFEPYDMYGGPAAGGWTEQLDTRAFDKTLKEKPDLHLLINHDGMPLARTKSGTLQLSVDDHGLKVRAELDRRDPDAAALERKMIRGDMDEMSFAFRVKGQEWSATPEFKDDPEALRKITEVSLHKGDVSVVNWGANPTTHAEVLSAPDLLRALNELDLAEVRGDDELLRQTFEKLSAVVGKPTVSANASYAADEIRALEDMPTGTPIEDAVISAIANRSIAYAGQVAGAAVEGLIGGLDVRNDVVPSGEDTAEGVGCSLFLAPFGDGAADFRSSLDANLWLAMQVECARRMTMPDARSLEGLDEGAYEGFAFNDEYRALFAELFPAENLVEEPVRESEDERDEKPKGMSLRYALALNDD